jgi:hypothetical protein
LEAELAATKQELAATKQDATQLPTETVLGIDESPTKEGRHCNRSRTFLEVIPKTRPDPFSFRKGGLKDAEDMFLDLAIKGKGKDITPKGFNGMVVEFPDGGIIRFRPTSTSGPPTIDIIIKYLGIDEIKFIP